MQPDTVEEFYDYYKTPRAAHERNTGMVPIRSVDKLAQFDPPSHVEKPVPARC